MSTYDNAPTEPHIDDEDDDHSVELRLATDEQILDELGRRYRTVVMAWDRVNDDGSGLSEACPYWRGGAMAAQGLAQWLADYIRFRFHPNRVPETEPPYGDSGGNP